MASIGMISECIEGTRQLNINVRCLSLDIGLVQGANKAFLGPMLANPKNLKSYYHRYNYDTFLHSPQPSQGCKTSQFALIMYD